MTQLKRVFAPGLDLIQSTTVLLLAFQILKKEALGASVSSVLESFVAIITALFWHLIIL
jgi:hypothetical protein